MPVAIRPVEARDHDGWSRLWQGYLRFYEAALADEVTRNTWKRILDPSSRVGSIVAEDAAGRLVGMSNYILHDNTWELAPVCYLQDLYVDPVVRAGGIGERLIDWLVAAMEREGWSRLYWLTREDNYRARGLYDRYTPRDAFVRYVLKAKR